MNLNLGWLDFQKHHLEWQSCVLKIKKTMGETIKTMNYAANCSFFAAMTMVFGVKTTIIREIRWRFS